MPRTPGATNLKPRIPKLCFTKNRGIGWHVHYRDPVSGVAKRHRFGMVSKEEANVAYHRWLVHHLGGVPADQYTEPNAEAPAQAGRPASVPGSVLEVASSLLRFFEDSIREDDATRARGTISRRVYIDREKHIKDFLAFVNKLHGKGAAARLRVEDLEMVDVEKFNRDLVSRGYSASQVSKRVQIVKRIIDRAGRPEHGQQRLSWNWDSRDVAHGKPSEARKLPTKKQLKKLLKAADDRGRLMIWIGIGLGFGAKDLSVIRVGQIDEDAYDLRRSKTGIERYGTTPPLVWRLVDEYASRHKRKPGELLFVSRDGLPLVRDRSDVVTQWWSKLRKRIGETKDTLSGFYVLRHLGATEFGSRPGTAISEMKRWLGHSASSDAADIYMRPVPPEYRGVVEWVRSQLQKPGESGSEAAIGSNE